VAPWVHVSEACGTHIFHLADRFLVDLDGR
jgi:hypothetical protein